MSPKAREAIARRAAALLEKMQHDDCGRGNCLLLNPVRPDLWCRACLIEEVQRLRYMMRSGKRVPLDI